MLYKDLEIVYTEIFYDKVLPYLKRKIVEDYYSEPVFYLLKNLKINRFRSGLPILIGKAYGVDESLMLPLSAFCEVTFTTAMAQDDFYDNDDRREGIEAAHKRFGVERTLLSCDYVNCKMTQILQEDLLKNGAPLDKVSEVLSIMNLGLSQAYKSVLMEYFSKTNLSEMNENLLKQIYLNKTVHGRILLECVFILVEEKTEIIDSIRKYSEFLAIAGQLKNDIYDYVKHQKYRGFSDLKQGHITWPLYILIRDLTEEQKMIVFNDLSNQRYDNLIKALKEAGVIQKTIDLMGFFISEAKKISLEGIPKEIKEILVLWADGNKDFSKEPKL
jgi:geranylgeranyl pyrophosphate synthase